MKYPDPDNQGLARDNYGVRLRNDMLANRKVIVFHHDDADGCFAAAAAALALDPESPRVSDEANACVSSVTYVPVNYGYKKEDILPYLETDDPLDVFVLDFAFDAELSDIIKSKTNFFLTLDHHKSNAEMLEGKKYAIFDMNASGAKMAYEYFFSGEKIPLAVTLADNRDLWKKTDGREDAFHEFFMYSRTVKHKDQHRSFISSLVNLMIDTGLGLADEKTANLCKMGEVMLMKRNASINYMCLPSRLVHTVIGGYPAVLVNAPVDQSDACEYLYSQEEHKDKIVGAFSIGSKGITFSLRRNNDLDVDLSYVASSHYGGGGHPKAAGFRVDLKRGVDIIQNREKWCLCWKSEEVDKILQSTTDNVEIAKALSQLKTELRSRATVETDTAWLQILPYIVVKHKKTDAVFFYSRPPGGGESRLYGKLSCGLGGHVDESPSEAGLATLIDSEAYRELSEEVGLDANVIAGDRIEKMFEKGLFKVLRLHDTAVETVHIGLAFTVEVEEMDSLTKISDGEVLNPQWLNPNQIAELDPSTMEVWTRVLLGK